MGFKMKLFKNIFLALLLLTSLNLTQTFAMEPDTDEPERLSAKSNDDGCTSKKIKFLCEVDQYHMDFPIHLVGQSIFLSKMLEAGNILNNGSLDDIISISTSSTIFSILIRLMEETHQLAQSQEKINLKFITQQLSLQIKQLDEKQINDLKKIADFLHVPLILNACDNATNNNTDINIFNPFDLIMIDYIPLSFINNALQLDLKSLNFNVIYDACNSIDNFCNLLIKNTENNFYLSTFLDRISIKELKDALTTCLINKIKDIFESTEINEIFNLTPDLKMLLSPKIFLRFLLVLPEENLNPFLDKLSSLVTNNLLVNYDLTLAQVLLCINNHREKNNILSQLGIIGGEALINNAKTTRSLNLPSNDLGNSDNLNKFLFYIAIAQILNVTYLNLSFKNLTSLPAEIGNLTSLTYLNLSYNKLKRLPVQIGNLTNLINLYLSDNNLTSLPAEIVKLTRLKSLYLHGNKHLTSLPAEMHNLSNLNLHGA